MSVFYFGIISVAAGILVLVGWQFKIASLQIVVMGLAPMNPLAAVWFILSGAAICALYFSSSSLEAGQEKIRQEIGQAKALDDSLLASIGDGVVATDNEGKVILFNVKAEEMFGIKAHDAISKPAVKLWSIYNKDGELVSDENRPLQISLLTGKTITSSVDNPFYYAKADKKIPVAITMAPVIRNGSIVGVIDVFRDISREVETDRAKSEFVSFASHQLRTPTTAIGWQTENFLKDYGDKLDDKGRGIINDIYKENRQVSDLITDFLSVAKIEYGITAVQSVPINLVEIIDNIIDEQCKVQISQKNIQVEQHIDRGICVVNADTELYKLVINNLVTNSIKYTADGGKINISLIKIKAGELAGNRKMPVDSCVLTVEDNGYGIPAAEQDKIFSRFYRAENVKNKNIAGTGLGLYMVKLFVEKMGGEIWFVSEENKGTKFFVRI